ncbi:RNB domain-containing protein [Cladophialophora immunda]|nr:RNB domain-containing protein [Cladophialophora immunda]
MLASRSHAGNVTKKRLRYICPECQTNALLSTFFRHNQRKRLQASKPTRLQFRQHGKRFGTLSSSLASLETSQAPAPVDTFRDITLGPSATPRSSSSSSTNPAVTSDSVIRNHLRAWSAENNKKKRKEADANSDSPKLKRLSVLPNSLFIEEASLADNTLGEDEELGAGDLPEVWEDVVEGGNVPHLDPGDLIWWQPGKYTAGAGRFARSQLAIFLGTLGWQRQYLLSDGRWVVEKSVQQPSPRFKQFASQQEIDQIRKHLPVKPLEMQATDFEVKMGYSFAGDTPSVDSETLITRLAQFIDEMSTWRRENLALLDSLYDRIADEERYISLSYEQVVSKLLAVKYSEVPPAALFTIYRTLRRKHVAQITVLKKTHYPSATVAIMPKRLARRFDQVCTWAREYQEAAASAAMGKDVTGALARNPLSSFVAKARRLILKSRTLRSPTTIGSLGPSSLQATDLENGKIPVKENDEAFTEEDKMFLEFLWDCYVRYPPPDNNRNLAIASLILRAIGAYPKLRLDQNMGCLLLQELGTLPPWFLRSDHNVTLEIPGGRGSHELTRVYDDADRFCHKIGLSKTLDHGLLVDSMASLRQDFGHLPVYCIDAGETNIREDGFSIEPSSEIPGAYWIHGHVSHPTAFIDPEHIIAQRALKLTESVFHNTYVARMVPDSFTRTLSLRSGSPAITVSTLFTEAGDVKDIKIRPTTLRNVIYLSNAAVEYVLGKPEYEAATLSLGPQAGLPPKSLQQAAPADIEKARTHISDLQRLEKLLLAREESRRRSVAVAPDWEVQGSLSTQSYVHITGSRFDEDSLFRSQQYQGDPAIRITVSRYMRLNRVKEMPQYVTLTALCGDLVAESAGKWFQDRKLPACFFGSSYAADFPPAKLNKLARGEHAEYPLGKLSSSPIPHVHKSHQVHLWFSNPLRRYPDLMAHWQVDAYLRAEASGAIQPGDPGDELQLPISKEMVDKFILEHSPKMYEWAREISRNERKHWITQALFRAFHFREADLPEVWDVNVTSVNSTRTRPDDSGLRGVLLPFNVYAVILASNEGWEKGVKYRSFLPVKLELVDLVRKTVVVRAVGPPSETYTQSGPIHITPNARSRTSDDAEASDAASSE